VPTSIAPTGSESLPGRPACAPGPHSTAKLRRQLSLTAINFWIDVLLFVVLCLLGWISTTLQIVFPAADGRRGWTLWGLGYDRWRDIQFGVLCTFALLILVHLMMHWNWVCSVFATQILRTRQRVHSGNRTIYGVAALIVVFHVLAAGLIAALLSVRPPAS